MMIIQWMGGRYGKGDNRIDELRNVFLGVECGRKGERNNHRTNKMVGKATGNNEGNEINIQKG
jgi:hypothetical protein